MKKALILCLLLASAAATRSWADEGRIPIFKPTTITQSGHYVLTRDIVVTAGDGIVIGASGVTLDLNGHLIASNVPTSRLIYIGDVENTAATIRNGRLSGGFIGIDSFTKPGLRLRVEHVEIEGSERAVFIDLAQSVQIIGCRVTGTTGSSAIRVSGPAGGTFTGEFVDNLITDVRGDGLELYNLRGGVVRGNVVTNFGTGASFDTGILLDSLGTASADLGGSTIDGNTVRKSDDDIGISVLSGSNNLLTNNVASGLGATGIFVQTAGNRIAYNVASSNAIDGIHIGCPTCGADHNTLERNTLRRNMVNGVSVQGNTNLIDSNLIEGNSQYGILFDSGTGSAYRGNMLRDNTIGAVLGTATDAGGNIL